MSNQIQPYNQSEPMFNTDTEKGKKNIFMASTAALGLATFWDNGRQKAKSWFGMYETVHVTDPDSAPAADEEAVV